MKIEIGGRYCLKAKGTNHCVTVLEIEDDYVWLDVRGVREALGVNKFTNNFKQVKENK